MDRITLGSQVFLGFVPRHANRNLHLKKNMCAHVHKKTRMYTHNYTQIDYIYIYIIYMLYVCEFIAHVYVYIYIFLWGTCKCKQKCINMQTRYWSFIFWDKLDQLTNKDIHSPFWLQRGGNLGFPRSGWVWGRCFPVLPYIHGSFLKRVALIRKAVRRRNMQNWYTPWN